jgi:hypothetical protein
MLELIRACDAITKRKNITKVSCLQTKKPHSEADSRVASARPIH